MDAILVVAVVVVVVEGQDSIADFADLYPFLFNHEIS